MGAWGHQPKDNDGAWDIADTALAKAEAWLASEYARLMRVSKPAVKAERRRPKYAAETDAWRLADARFVRAGAVQILLERGVHVRRALVVQAADDLDFAIGTEEYMKGWRDPRRARAGAARVLAALRALLVQGHWRKGMCFSTRRKPGWKFHPATHILAPFGWPAENAGKRSWTGIELHRLGRVRVRAGGRRSGRKAKRPVLDA